MSDALATPWTDVAVAPAARAATSFARLAAPLGAPVPGRAAALVCPWSSSALPVPVAHPVTCLPTLAPTVPTPRSAVEPPVVATL